MVTEEEIDNNPNLTEEEKEIAKDVIVHKKSYRVVMKERHTNPTKIRDIKLIATGHKDSGTEKFQDGLNYSEMYRRFQNGQRPPAVAIALNLPINLVQQHYIQYIEGSKVPGFAKLYAELGYDGFSELELIRESMKRSGYANLKLAGKFVAKAEELVHPGNTAETLEAKASKLQGNIAWMTKEKVARQKNLEELDKVEREKSKKIEDFEGMITRLRQMNPNATAAEAATEAIREVLNNRRRVFAMEIESLLYGARSDFDLLLYVKWFLFPNTREANVSDYQIMSAIMQSLPPIAQDVCDKFINLVKNRITLS